MIDIIFAGAATVAMVILCFIIANKLGEFIFKGEHDEDENGKN